MAKTTWLRKMLEQEARRVLRHEAATIRKMAEDSMDEFLKARAKALGLTVSRTKNRPKRKS